MSRQERLPLNITHLNAARSPSRPPVAVNHPILRHATPAYDSYWRLASERQEVFFRRLQGTAPPWTQDPVLQSFKFTNAYRASDRVSQYLIRHVLRSGEYSAKDTFFRVLLFKLFNKVETWRLLEAHFTTLTAESFQQTAYDAVLSGALQRGHTIYSAAYIMPSGGRAVPFQRKHQFHLWLLQKMLDDQLWKRLQEADSLKTAFELLRSYPGIGDFLAFQYAIDLNYSSLMNFSENDFVVAGPGALDGISKCFPNCDSYKPSDVIKIVCERQDAEFQRLGLAFKDLWGRPLQLIDCQNLFCEVSKYSRVAHPEILGVAGRTRIKQGYTPAARRLEQPMYPHKWGLDEAITSWTQRTCPAPSPALFDALVSPKR